MAQQEEDRGPRAGPEPGLRPVLEARPLGPTPNEHGPPKPAKAVTTECLADLGIDRAFLQRLVGAFPHVPLAVVLFGSAARGNLGTSSDLDLLVVFDREVRIQRSLYRCLDATVDVCDFRHAPDLLLVTLPASVHDCSGLWLDAAVDGVVLWERGTAVSAFLGALRDQIASGALQRGTAYGQRYWVRCEDRVG